MASFSTIGIDQMATAPNGAIIYRGPSMLDGKPIVVVATGLAKSSTNEKTGALVQTWILRDDVSPVDAVNSGDDASICGDCIHRGTIVDGKNKGRSCYVTVFQAPQNVYKCAQRGLYAMAEDLAGLFAGKAVRCGSYGDPAAVPFHIWEAALSKASYWTGYTHQWRSFPELSAFCMASADSELDRITANMLGFRTFRVRALSDPVLAREVICPASQEAGYKTTCAACKACGGTSAKAKVDIVIAAHGAASKVNAYAARIAA